MKALQRFELVKALVKDIEPSVLDLFFSKVKRQYDRLWSEYIFEESEQAAGELCSMLEDLCESIFDASQWDELQDRIRANRIHSEVNEMFSDDKTELECWQDFERSIQYDNQQDLYDLYRNEY